MNKNLKTLLLLFIATQILAHTAEEWKNRTIYQLLTDRFARTDNSTEQCSDWHKYCGGTFKGIIYNLDYIQGMGFDAIWISPIPVNLQDNYHGYAAMDFSRVNDHFGTLEDLKHLIAECHRRNIWVLLDIVGNHMACVGDTYDTPFSDVTPFNDIKYYHQLCYITQHDWDTMNQYDIEHCRLACLADLDQDN